MKRVVGLSYKPDEGPPTVVLRGVGPTAETLLDEAAVRRKRLPVVQNKTLLEQLYRLPLDAPIDPSLYELVATLLVHVFAVDEAVASITERERE